MIPPPEHKGKLDSFMPDSCMQFADCIGLDKAAAKGLNFLFSPLSIRAALSLAAAGSNGSTLLQFLSFLGSDTLNDLNIAARSLLASVRTTTDSIPKPGDGGSYLSLANGLWVCQKLVLKPTFKEIAATIYNAEAKSVDMDKVLEVVEEVNTWAEQQTNGLIKKLIPLSDVKDDTKVILVNAVCFKGTWLRKFDRSETSYKEFHLLDGTSVEVPFMHRHAGTSECIGSFDGFKVLKMDYEPNEASRQFSMLIFLPDESDKLKALVAKAVADTSFFKDHVPTELVEVGKFWIPKFRFSCAFKPSAVLPSLGLDLPFDKDKADLTETAFPPEPGFKLFISTVRHKAAIEVGEEDTEAAAATEVIYRPGCSFNYQPPPRVDFVADHPFMFAIGEDQSGAIVFIGYVLNPSSTDETTVQ